MCGFCGLLGPTASDPYDIARRMSEKIVHRGPNDFGCWANPDVGIALAHRRLSIIDLSPAGRQPMHSLTGRFVIAFNGEIYNHCDLRRQLDSERHIIWRGHSDTEVILAAFEVWGVEKTVKRLIGMFAIGLWDSQKRILHLIRDRIGEKPLYYGCVGETLLFASELKCLTVFPEWRSVVDRNALTLYLRHNYIPAPYTIYKGIKKLSPGTILSLSLDTYSRDSHAVPFWSARQIAEQGLSDPFTGNEDQAASQLDRLLQDVVRQQMEADVPLGAFLSGGVDSSIIVALMQSQSTRPVKTFTVGFHEDGYNESGYAKEVAGYLKTDHTEIYVTSSDALSVIPMLSNIYDEPFSDSSQIPTFLIAQLTRKHVTVSLSGDAGDELFGGYSRYFWCKDIWQKISWMPVGMRAALARGIHFFSPQFWDRLLQMTSHLFPGDMWQQASGDRLHKLAEMFGAYGPLELYHGLVSHCKTPERIVLNSSEPMTCLTDAKKWLKTDDFVSQMMYLDLISYLPDDILVKVDRASMNVSLETRIPFLDHRVIDFAWRLPLTMKMRNGQGKWLLRQVLYKYVPKELIERPKTGFSVPIGMWLRGPLREWATALLEEKLLHAEGFFDPYPIRQKWQEHLSGRRNWHYYLWNILMFQAWLERNPSSLGEEL